MEPSQPPNQWSIVWDAGSACEVLQLTLHPNATYDVVHSTYGNWMDTQDRHDVHQGLSVDGAVVACMRVVQLFEGGMNAPDKTLLLARLLVQARMIEPWDARQGVNFRALARRAWAYQEQKIIEQQLAAATPCARTPKRL